MELLDLVNKTLEIFEVGSTEELGAALMKVVEEHNTSKYSEFLALSDGDLSEDLMQRIFQYYEADRTKGKSQDFTPKSLAKLVAALTEGDCIDMCAGTGALTIQRWNRNKDGYFICAELDENVIPYLLFNLALRNMSATVFRKDVLNDEIYAEWQVWKSSEFSTIRRVK